MTEITEKTLRSEYVYRGKTISVRKDIVKLPNGKEALREVVEHPGAVAVAAVNDQNELIMVRQFRYAFEKEILEIPAGKMDKGPEGPLEAARRELKEETGLTAGKLTYLGGMYPSVGFLNEVIHLFLAQDLTEGSQNPDEDEFLKVTALPFGEVVSMVLNGEISDAKTVVGVLRSRERLGL